MKTEKIIWGLVLVFIGAILLFQNLGVIDFNWEVLFRFWPVILILIGANLLFSRDESRTGALITLTITLLAIGFITYKGVTTEDEDHWSFEDTEHEEHAGHESEHIYKEDFEEGIAKAVLNISGGAIDYRISDTTNSLFQADVKRNFGNFSLRRTSADSVSTLNFNLNGKTKWTMKENKSNHAVIRLNPKPVWEINLEMGAGKADFDLSQFKIGKLDISGGAASFHIKLGQPLKTTNVSVETGVSEVEIEIPRTAACKIKVDSGLSSDSFEGFSEQGDGTYTTENYKDENNAIQIDLQGGMSQFEVKRY